MIPSNWHKLVNQSFGFPFPFFIFFWLILQFLTSSLYSPISKFNGHNDRYASSSVKILYREDLKYRVKDGKKIFSLCFSFFSFWKRNRGKKKEKEEGKNRSKMFAPYLRTCGSISWDVCLHVSTQFRLNLRIFSRSSGQSRGWPMFISKSRYCATWLLISWICCEIKSSINPVSPMFDVKVSAPITMRRTCFDIIHKSEIKLSRIEQFVTRSTIITRLNVTKRFTVRTALYETAVIRATCRRERKIRIIGIIL